MNLKQKLYALECVGEKIQYAIPSDAYANGSLRTYSVTAYPASEHDRPFMIIRDACDHHDASYIDRSNFRSIERDYPGATVHVGWELGFFPHSVSDDFIRAVCGLADYALWDESDLSELESDEISNAWSEYLQFDLFREIPGWANELSDRYDNDTLRDAFYAAIHDADYYPEASGNEIHWDYEKCGEILTDVIRKLRRAELGRP